MNNELNASLQVAKSVVNESAINYLDMGGAFVIGLSVGYALKKSFKVLLLLLGLGMIFVFFLESQGAVEVNEKNMEGMVATGVQTFQSFVVLLQNRMENYTALGTGSAIAGFFIGLKLG